MPEAGEKSWPGYTGECHPEIWNLQAKPPQPLEKKSGQLTEQQLNEYFEQGVVLVENYFTADELEPIKKDIEKLVDYIADLLYKGGKITKLYEDFGLFERLTMINSEFRGANIMINKLEIMPQSIRDLWSSDKLCNAMEQIIGPDIGGHPVWNLRTKTPQDEATTVPWHQDCAYLDTTSYTVHQPTAWIPLLDATPANGCMEFAVGGHRLGKIAMHQCCEGDTHYVMLEPEEMAKNLDVDLAKDLKVMPVRYGSVLFFNNCIPHRSLNNLSGFPGVVRWSLDLRWQDFKKSYGFHNLAQGMPFRKAEDPKWRPSSEDWDAFLKTPRLAEFEKQQEQELKLKDPFTYDTTIVGPWMKSWEIVHMNRHTTQLSDSTLSTWHSHNTDTP